MARREITQFFDDIDNKPLSEEELIVIRFSVDGKDYLLDVSQDNADKFHAALEPFVKAARHPVKRTPVAISRPMSAYGPPSTATR